MDGLKVVLKCTQCKQPFPVLIPASEVRGPKPRGLCPSCTRAQRG